MTVNLKLGEVLTQAIVDKLRAGLDTRCQAINAEKNDNTVIRAPATEDYYQGRVAELPKTPAIFVLEGTTTFEEEGSHGLMTTTDVLVHIIESDQTGPLLSTRLRRQVRAVIETLWDDPPQEKLVGSAFHLIPRRTIPGPVFEPDSDHHWRSSYVIVFRARTFENEP